MRILLLCLLLIGCGRALTPGEVDFISTIQGDTFDPAPVRIGQTELIGIRERTYAVRPRTTCKERILPPIEGDTFQSRTAGVVLFQRMMTRPDWYLDSYVEGPDGSLNLIAAMFFAHEMTHIWQWQNRDITGYHPLKAAVEQLDADPYLFDPQVTRPFLDFGYEQQAALVEEYLCCRSLDPLGARSIRLYETLSEVMPVADPRTFQQTPVWLPWDNVETDGLCS